MKNLKVTVNGTAYNVTVEEMGAAPAQTAAPVAAPAPAPAAAPAPAPVAAPAGEGQEVTSPMPGTVLDIKVSNGQAVKAGDTLAILEAMKMENEIPAPCDGTITSVVCSKGEAVESGSVLFTIA